MTMPETLPPEEQEPSGTFNPNEYDWSKHLKVMLEDLKVKNVEIDRDWDYYDGKHPKVWLTDAIKDKLDDQLITNMAENWTDVATDSPVRRLSVDGFVDRSSEDQEVKDNAVMSTAAKNVWKDNQLRLGQKDVYRAALVAGESFVFAWKAEPDDDRHPAGIEAIVKDARNVWWPEDTHRSDPTRVGLIWADHEEGIWRATMYYKYVVVRLVGPKLKDSGGIDTFPLARYFQVDPEDPGGEHGFDKVPVIRFSEFTKRRSLVARLATLQDKINKLAANLLVTAEFNAWRKMAILTTQLVDDDDLKWRPNRAMVLDPGGGDGQSAPTTIWEGEQTDLGIYSDEQDKLINKLFTKACLPGHLKVQSDKTLPSGAAYEADEGPFTEYIADLKDSYGESWHDFYVLTLGIDVECQWRDPHVRSEESQAVTVKTMVDAGMPISLALKYYAGWTDDQLKELEDAPMSPKEQLAMAASEALINEKNNPDSGSQLSGAKPGISGAKRPVQKATSAKAVS